MGAAAHPDVTRLEGPVARDLVVEIVTHLDDLLRAQDEDAAAVSQLDARRRAHEQLLADLLLDALNAARERRLGEREGCGRAREAAVLGKREDVAHLADVQGHA